MRTLVSATAWLVRDRLFIRPSLLVWSLGLQALLESEAALIGGQDGGSRPRRRRTGEGRKGQGLMDSGLARGPRVAWARWNALATLPG